MWHPRAPQTPQVRHTLTRYTKLTPAESLKWHFTPNTSPLLNDVRHAISKDTDMAPEVIAQASSHQVVGLLLLPQTVQGQALHRQGLWRGITVKQTVRGTVNGDRRRIFSFICPSLHPQICCLPPCSANLGLDRICLQNLSPFLYCLCS